MRLFLTSTGLVNDSIVKSFNELVGLPKNKINIAFIPTAANVEVGDKSWLIDDLNNLKKQGYECVDVVDISAVSQEMWRPRLEKANVLFFGGGNTTHLMYWLTKSGLDKLLPKLLETRVFAGISAGSCVTGKTINNPVQNLYGEKYEVDIRDGLGLVDFQFIPHLNTSYFDKIRKEYLTEEAAKMTETIYAADDNTAIKVDDGEVEIISEGEYLVFNKQ
jgi:dipeptidase E